MDGGRSGQRGSHAQSDAQLGSVMKVEPVRATGSRLLERQVGCSNHPHPPTPSSVPRKSENLEIFFTSNRRLVDLFNEHHLNYCIADEGLHCTEK